MGKRRSKEEKINIIKEVELVKNRRAVAAKHGLSESTIRTWEKKLVGESLSPKNNSNRIEKDYRNLIKENRALKEIAAEKDLEIKILKDLVKKM